MSIDRTHAELILGSRIYICRLGTTVESGGSTQTVSENFVPDPPTSYKQPGAWSPLGKISSSKTVPEEKTSEVRGVGDNGTYIKTKMNLTESVLIQFSTNDIAPEAFELSFGLKSPGAAGQDQDVFANGSNTIDVWLFQELTDAYRAKTGLASLVVRGKLKLQNPLEAREDPAQADYELSVEENDLNSYTPTEDVL